MFFHIAKKGYNSIWLYTLILIAILLLTNLFSGISLVVALVIKNAINHQPIFSRFEAQLNTLPFSSNLTLILLLIPFFIGLVLLLLAVRFIHHKKILSVVTSRLRVDKNRLIFILILWINICFIFFLIDYYIQPNDYVYQFEPYSFLKLFVIVLLLIPFQTAFEEILFRGYLMQGIGIATNSRWIALVVTSVLFGLMHSLNPEIDTLGFWQVMPYYIGFGLFLGIVAIADAGLELSIGIHMANNIFAALVVSSDKSVLHTDAIFKIKELTIGWIDYIGIFAGFLILFFVLKRVYKWQNLQNIYLPITIK